METAWKLLLKVGCLSLLGFSWIGGTVRAHLTLTNPPARQPSFDFLDNVRTRWPCGGIAANSSQKMTFAIGETINVTWRMAYRHQGGIQFNLLDHHGTTLASLPVLNVNANADGFYLSDQPQYKHRLVVFARRPIDDTTAYVVFSATHAIVQVSPEVRDRCTDGSGCVLQLVRQAAEWGAAYRFLSCADVRIAADPHSISASEQCLNNGASSSLGPRECLCSDHSSGPRCQYKGDCDTDSDCLGGGQCVEEEQGLLRKVCFCASGRFGANCQLQYESDECFNAQENVFNPSCYKYLDLSNGQRTTSLYYRNYMHDEVEIVAEFHSHSWVAVGWRPTDIDEQKCWLFPIGPHALPTPIRQPDNRVAPPAAEPESEPGPIPHSSAVPAPPGSPVNSLASHNSAQPEPAGHPEPHALPEQHARYARAEPEPEHSAEPGHQYLPGWNNAYFVGHRHLMNCQDMAIGAVKLGLDGRSYSRITDSYSRDRSTPLPDELLRGKNSLTAAAAYEYPESGVYKTVMMFRRKIKAEEPMDHSLDGALSMIWASGNVLTEDPYYKPDIIMYHASNRGANRNIKLDLGHEIVAETNVNAQDQTSSANGCLFARCFLNSLWLLFWPMCVRWISEFSIRI